jgi:hypothetical protein
VVSALITAVRHIAGPGNRHLAAADFTATKAVTVLLTMALVVSSPMGAPASATTDDGCTKGNVEGFAQGTIAVAKQSGPGRQENGTSGAWSNCQFRFYDDNGATTPHVFTDEECFLGGIFGWITDAEIEQFGLTPRPVAVADFHLFENTLLWREAGGAWEELELSTTAVRGVYAPFFGEVFHVMAHDYYIFEPGMSVGSYEWKWVVDAPWLPGPLVWGVGEVLALLRSIGTD